MGEGVPILSGGAGGLAEDDEPKGNRMIADAVSVSGEPYLVKALRAS
jgi:hypothetical protein